MATRGRPIKPDRCIDPVYQRTLWRSMEVRKLSLEEDRKLWLSKDGGPYRYRMPLGRPAGLLTLPNGLKCDMVHVIGMAEYFFYEAKERRNRITKKAAFEKGIEKILTDHGLRQSSAKRLAETAMHIHRDMVRELGFLPIK